MYCKANFIARHKSHYTLNFMATSHHTHKVIGTGANDPQKINPGSSRETLDHSIMYIFAVALEDAKWHHINSYTWKRAHKKTTVSLLHKIETHEDKIPAQLELLYLFITSSIFSPDGNLPFFDK